MRVAVVGARGFVGSAVVAACRRDGHDVRELRAPRLRSNATAAAELVEDAGRLLVGAPELTDSVRGSEVVVNAAGVADAVTGDVAGLRGPNSLLPVVLALACEDAQVGRFVHVSSAAVQGRRPVLDESSDRRPFSPYSESKAWAEEALEKAGDRTVIYRPTSVHGSSRGVTQRLARFASGPLSSVAGDGRQPSPQALIAAVGSAAAHLVGATRPPRVVMHPWEGVTTSDVLYWLSGRQPRHIPTGVALGAVQAAAAMGRIQGRAAGTARRLEMLWFGQEQAESWLSSDGWKSPVQFSDWQRLGLAIHDSPTRNRWQSTRRRV